MMCCSENSSAIVRTVCITTVLYILIVRTLSLYCTYMIHTKMIIILSRNEENEQIQYKILVKLAESFPDEGSWMLLKRWKNNCQFLASTNESLVMSIPSHSGLFKIVFTLQPSPFLLLCHIYNLPVRLQHFCLFPIDLHTPFIHHFLKHPQVPLHILILLHRKYQNDSLIIDVHMGV